MNLGTISTSPDACVQGGTLTELSGEHGRRAPTFNTDSEGANERARFFN